MILNALVANIAQLTKKRHFPIDQVNLTCVCIAKPRSQKKNEIEKPYVRQVNFYNFSSYNGLLIGGIIILTGKEKIRRLTITTKLIDRNTPYVADMFYW